MHTEMACAGDDWNKDWAAQQAMDEAEQKQQVAEAFEHLNDVINAVEREFNMRMDTTRMHLRYLELFVNRR